MKHFYFFIFLLLTSRLSVGQFGPGSVGLTNGGPMILWLDASQIENVANENNITTWNDLSAYVNNATQSTGNEKPNLKKNFLNGNAVVSFNGVTENLKGTLSVPTNSPLTVVSVGYFNQLNQGLDDNDYIFGLGTGGSAGNQLSIARRQNNGGTNTDQYYSWDGSTAYFGPVLAGQQWQVLTHIQNTTAVFHHLQRDGNAQVVNDYSTNLNTDGSFCIGDFYNSINDDFKLNGYVAEIIVFSKVLNSAELNILHSYLSAKYTIAVTGDKYTGDDPGNGNNDLTVAGIGEEADGDQMEAESDGLYIVRSSGMEDGDYLLFGHSQPINTINTADIAEASSLIESRWDRAWWLDVTDAGSPLSVNFRFDLNDSGIGDYFAGPSANYALLYRASGAGNWTIVATDGGYSGDMITFNNVALSADGYYTLGSLDHTNSPVGLNRTSLTNRGPGGIGDTDGSTELTLWLQPSTVTGTDDDFVLTLADYSGHGNDATQTATANIPRLKTNIVNGNAVIRLDGANDFYTGSLGGATTSPITMIGVAYFSNINQPNGDDDYLFTLGIDEGVAIRQSSIARRRGNVVADANKYFSRNIGTNTNFFGPVITGQQWTILTQSFRSSAPFHNLFINGASSVVTDYPSALTTNGTYIIGNLTTGNLWFNGDLGELIVFNKELNTAERNIIHSYLGAKFNRTVTGDKYAGDDVGNGHYDFGVAGIGTEADGSNLAATSSGFFIEQVSNFATGDYVLLGHKTLFNTVNYSDIGHAGSLLQARWERVWFADVTDDASPVMVNITLDFSDADIAIFPGGDPANYKLLHRAGQSGDWTFVADGTGITGDQVSFGSVVMNGDGYYALGTIDALSSPLPVTLIEFNAAISNREVNLDWATATEVDNDYFDVERAIDGILFEKIGRVEGAGTSESEIHYAYQDQNPPAGLIYYRLKQVDRSGQKTYTPIRSVVNETKNEVVVFPNPATRVVHIQLNPSDEGSQVDVMDYSGRIVYSTSLVQETTALDVSPLPKGVYILKVTNNKSIVMKKVVIQ